MNAKTQTLIDEARRLSQEEQAEIVETLLGDLGNKGWYSADDLVEWERRAAEVRADPSQAIDADAAIAHVRARLARARSR